MSKIVQRANIGHAIDETLGALREQSLSPDFPDMVAQTPDELLAYYRSVYPYIQVLPLPAMIRTVILTPGGVAADLSLPDDAALGIFKGNGDYYVSWQGNAEVPVAPPLFGTVNSMSVFKPEYAWFFIANNRQVSVISPAAGATVVQVHCLPIFREPTWGQV